MRIGEFRNAHAGVVGLELIGVGQEAVVLLDRLQLRYEVPVAAVGHVKARRAHQIVLRRVVCHERGAKRSDGQQQHDAHHRHGAECRPQLAGQLPHHEQIQVLVVEPLPQLRELEQKARKRQEEQQRAQAPHRDDDQQRKVQRVELDFQDPDVRADQQRRRQHEQHHAHPQMPRQERALVAPVGLQQLDEPRARDAEHIEHAHHQEDDRKVEQCLSQAGKGDHEVVVDHGHVVDPRDEHRERLAEQQPQRKARRQRQHAHHQRLHQQHQRDPASLDAQRHVQAELPLAPPEYEVICIEDQSRQHHGDDRRNDGDGLQHEIHQRALLLRKAQQHLLAVQRVEHVENAHAEGQRQKVDGVVLEGAQHVFEGEVIKHCSRHPQARSRPR